MVHRSSSLPGVASVGLLLPNEIMLSQVTTGTPAFSALSCSHTQPLPDWLQAQERALAYTAGATAVLSQYTAVGRAESENHHLRAMGACTVATR